MTLRQLFPRYNEEKKNKVIAYNYGAWVSLHSTLPLQTLPWPFPCGVISFTASFKWPWPSVSLALKMGGALIDLHFPVQFVKETASFCCLFPCKIFPTMEKKWNYGLYYWRDFTLKKFFWGEPFISIVNSLYPWVLEWPTPDQKYSKQIKKNSRNLQKKKKTKLEFAMYLAGQLFA